MQIRLEPTEPTIGLFLIYVLLFLIVVAIANYWPSKQESLEVNRI